MGNSLSYLVNLLVLNKWGALDTLGTKWEIVGCVCVYIAE